jgi:dihydrolipoamide dehydrogenase
MLKKIVLDKLMKNASQGKVGKIAKNVGDTVSVGDKLMQIESVKGASVIKSKFNGEIKSLADEGANVKVGAVLAEIEVED